MLKLLALCCLLLPHQESSLIDKLLAELDLEKENCRADLIVTKALPHNPATTVVVIPENAEDGDFYAIYHNHVLLVDTETGKIKSRYFKERGLTTDAVRLEAITIDTAPYLLKDNQRAFGIRVSYTGSSGPNPYSSQDLTLFLTEGAELWPILEEFTIEQYNGDWNTRCAGEFLKQEKVVIITKNKTDGYFDLTIRNKQTKTVAKPVGGDCKRTETIDRVSTVLKYDKEKRAYLLSTQ